MSAPKPSYLARQETGASAPWVDKGTIGRPKINGEGFVRLWGDDYEKDRSSGRGMSPIKERGDSFDRNLISAPRPARPTSAEPLGRLSGLGMGMGYLK